MMATATVGICVMTVSLYAQQRGIRIDTLTEVFGHLSPEDPILLKPSEEIHEGPVIP